MRLKMKKRSHRYDLNRPWPRNGDKYTKYKMCLSILLFGCPTANFGPFSRVQHQYPDVNHCIFYHLNWKVSGRLVKQYLKLDS